MIVLYLELVYCIYDISLYRLLLLYFDGFGLGIFPKGMFERIS